MSGIKNRTYEMIDINNDIISFSAIEIVVFFSFFIIYIDQIYGLQSQINYE